MFASNCNVKNKTGIYGLIWTSDRLDLTRSIVGESQRAVGDSHPAAPLCLNDDLNAAMIAGHFILRL